MKYDIPLIGGIQFHKPFFQILRTVRYVFHDVGREPNLADTQLLIKGENLQGFLHRLHTVIHTGKQVAVPVGKSPEDVAILQTYLFSKGPHLVSFFLHSSFFPYPA